MPILVAAISKRYTALSCFIAILIIVISVSSSNWISKVFSNVEDDELTIQIKVAPVRLTFSRTEEIGRKVESAGCRW